jgi:hypothetical protein
VPLQQVTDFLTGALLAAALKENAYLFDETPSIETADVLAAKLPG